MKKTLSILLILTLILTTFTACGTSKTSSSTSGQKVTLNLCHPPYGTKDVLDADMWKPVLEKFEKENNCKINLTIVPWDNYEEKYMTGITGKVGPDVGYMYAEMLPSFIEMGALQPIDKYITDADKANYIYYDKGFMYGKQYGLPIVVGAPRVLYYNKDILDKLGEKAPTTWEDFERICKEATKDTNGDGKIDQWGYAAGWGGKAYGDLNENFDPFLWQAGGDLYSADNKTVAFNSEAGKKAADFLYKLKFTDKVIPTDATGLTEGEALSNYFGTGKAAFYICSTNTAAKAFKDYPKLKWGFTTSLKDVKRGTFIAADQLVLMSSTKYPELSAKLMKYLVSKESMTRFHQYNQFPPVTKDEDYHGDPAFKDVFTNDTDALVALKPAPYGFKVYDYLYKELQSMMMGQKTPEQALSESEKYGNDLIKNGGK